MYDIIGKQLAQKGIHALSLASRILVKVWPKNLTLKKFMNCHKKHDDTWSVISAHWPKDTQLAYDYLKVKRLVLELLVQVVVVRRQSR